MKQSRAENRRRADRGFSVIEVMISVIIIFIISAMAIVQIGPAMQQSKASAATAAVLSVFRQAREYSVSRRHYTQVLFVNYPKTKNDIRIVDLVALSGGVGPDIVVSEIVIDPATQFTPSAVGDTPDGFGNCGAVCIAGVDGGPPPTMMFQPDGEFVNVNGNPINGTVFLQVVGAPETARALTILGATGRIRKYHVDSAASAWVM